MSEEAKQPPEQPPVNKKILRRIELAWDSLFEFFSLGKLGSHLKLELLEIKNRAPILFVILIGIIGWLAWKNIAKESQLSKLTVASKEADHQLEIIKGELNGVKQDRDKYQLLLAPFQAMAIQIYTNVPINERLEFLATQFSSTSSNLLTAIESEKPSFNLYINNQLVNDGTVISLKDARRLDMRVKNISSVSADQLTVDFYAPLALAVSDLICDFSWKQSHEVRLEHSRELIGYGWHWVSDEVLGGDSGKGVNPLEISKNMTSPKIMVLISVYSSHSKIQTYNISLTF